MGEASANGVIIAVLIVYFAVLIGIGWWASRESHSVAGFYVAGKKLPSWVIAFSSNTTGESGWLLLGLTGMGYLVGFHALWVVLGEVIGVALAWSVVARPYKEYTDRYDAITVPDCLSDRFADRTHIIRIVSAIIIFSMVWAYTSAQLTASGKAFSSFLGPSYEAGRADRSGGDLPVHQHRRFQGRGVQRRAPGRAHVPVPAGAPHRGDLARGGLGRTDGRDRGGGSGPAEADGRTRPVGDRSDERAELRRHRPGLPGGAPSYSPVSCRRAAGEISSGAG